MLGRLEMDVDQCIEAYSELTQKVFGKKKSHFSINISLEVKSKFSSKKLDEAFLEVLKKNKLSGDTKMDDGTERGCRTYV